MTHVSKAYHIVTFLIRIVLVTPSHFVVSESNTFTASGQLSMVNFSNLLAAALLITTLSYKTEKAFTTSFNLVERFLDMFSIEREAVKACTVKLSEHWRGHRTQRCDVSDPGCSRCGLEYSQCEGRRKETSKPEELCNICFKTDEIPTNLHGYALKRCYKFSKSKIVVMKLSELYNECKANNHSETTFGKKFKDHVEKHLIANVIVNPQDKLIPFKTKYKKGINFPCSKDFKDCGIPEANVSTNRLKQLYDCMKCMCPSKNGLKSTPNTDMNSTITLEPLGVPNKESDNIWPTLIGGAGGGVVVVAIMAVVVFLAVKSWKNRKEEEPKVRYLIIEP